MCPRFKRKHKRKFNPRDAPIVNCTECVNCQYIGEGDYLCDVHMKIIIQDFDMSTSYRKCFAFIKDV